MIVLGLAGPAGAGKTSVAACLKSRYRYIPFSFSDSLYAEVVAAFGLPDESLLRDRETKEAPTRLLALKKCKDRAFVNTVCARFIGQKALSPRQILQAWGTEYRRAQDPDYWINKTEEWLGGLLGMFQYPEQRPQYFCCDTVRFPNEQQWIHRFTNGQVWHIHRDGIEPVHAHASEQALPLLDGEREIFNNSDLDHLHVAVDQLLRTSAAFVRMEPMLTSLEERLQARGYDLDKLDRDNPYTHEPAKPYKTPDQQVMEAAGVSEKDFS